MKSELDVEFGSLIMLFFKVAVYLNRQLNKEDTLVASKPGTGRSLLLLLSTNKKRDEILGHSHSVEIQK